MMLWVIVLLMIQLVLNSGVQFTQAIRLTDVVETNKGRIQGQVLTTVAKGIEYSAFKAIPYAKPPVGYRRFQPPEETYPWTNVLMAVNEPTNCPQWSDEDDTFVGHEDCLYLNVYTPKIDSMDRSRRPVMVWIYGGAFVSGYINSTSYGPDFLLEKNVVVVAMNYRIGALGFLSLNHENATGNAGLKDQNLALRWIRKNIHLFGGDPTQVTIFGQSAGSVAVELHCLSDLSVGLFQRSISMSGSPLNFWGFYTPERAEMRAFNLGRQLGVSTSDKDQLLKKLYSASAENIVAATRRMTLLDLPFKPTIEDPDIAKRPFLTDCVINKYKSGNFSKLPHILGFTHSETVSMAYGPVQLEQLINLALESTPISNVSPQLTALNVLRRIISENVQPIQSLSRDILNEAINITTDILFITGIDQTQQYWVAQTSAPVYYYRNSFDYPEAYHKVSGVNWNGTGHTDDLAHIFWAENYNQSLDPLSDIGIQREKMVRMWTNFAKYGNPTPYSRNDGLLNINWPPSGKRGYCLEITNDNYFVDIRPTDDLVKMDQRAQTFVRDSTGGCQSFASRLITSIFPI